jgi:hypothetical protein
MRRAGIRPLPTKTRGDARGHVACTAANDPLGVDVTISEIFSRPRALSLVVALAFTVALAAPGLAWADEPAPVQAAATPAAGDDAAGTEPAPVESQPAAGVDPSAATPVDTRAQATVDPSTLLKPVTEIPVQPLDPRIHGPTLQAPPAPVRLVPSTPPAQRPPSASPPPRTTMPTAPPAVVVVEPPAATVPTPETPGPSEPPPDAHATAPAPEASPAESPPAAETTAGPESTPAPAMAVTPSTAPAAPVPSVPVEPPGVLPFPLVPPASSVPQPGSESITIVVPTPPPAEEATPPPTDTDVAEPPPLIALPAQPLTFDPEVLPPPAKPIPAARAPLEAVPVASAVPSAVIASAARFAPTPTSLDAVRAIGASVTRSAPRTAAVAGPVQPPTDPDRERPGDPFGFSIAVSASGGASSVVTLALVAALIFFAALQLVMRLTSHVAVWRQRALPAPLPRPG